MHAPHAPRAMHPTHPTHATHTPQTRRELHAPQEHKTSSVLQSSHHQQLLLSLLLNPATSSTLPLSIDLANAPELPLDYPEP
eukprot:CAMPEP_0181314626 /NCGR_PEP_ID=MMETSP1101-20121128/14923_1 /TAXON_ID=46948 /ORGANISM="Rhodomonas abbreviata, Strain Caron Lab Isolate" /LENGTH=81 /DNA_ID=CAMNT_0023421741 /DNA_START=328 /DNA_END=570 /DNA_ORIENTATION=-